MCLGIAACLLLLYSYILAPTCLAKRHSSDSESEPAVTWVQPVSGATYYPGDTLVVQWNADKAVVSPSFRLCSRCGQSTRELHLERRRGDNVFKLLSRDSEGCGDTIWPTVETDSAFYSVTMEVPKIAEPALFCLVMQDNFGSSMKSPAFTVSPAAASSSDTETAAAGNDNASQTPSEKYNDSSPSAAAVATEAAKQHVTDSSAEPTQNVVDPQPSVTPIAQAPLTPQDNTSNPSPSANATTNAPPVKSKQITPTGPIYIDSSDLLTPRHPTPIAAFAIPLCAAAAALLIAGGLAIRHRRALRADRERDALIFRHLEKLRNFSSSSSQSPNSSDIKPSVPPQLQLQPIPLFMPMSLPLSMDQAYSSSSMCSRMVPRYTMSGTPRETTRQAFTYVNSIDRSAGAGGGSINPSHSFHGNTNQRNYNISPSTSQNGSKNSSSAGTYNLPGSSSRSGSLYERTLLSAPHLPPLSLSSSGRAHGAVDPYLPPPPPSADTVRTVASANAKVESAQGAPVDVPDDYYLPSPQFGSAALLEAVQPLDTLSLPPPPKPPMLPLSLTSAPQRLYVRDESPSTSSISLLSTSHEDKLLPQTPVCAKVKHGGDAYAVVAALLDRKSK